MFCVMCVVCVCQVNLAGNPFLQHGPDVPSEERDALRALYTSTHGEGWSCNTGTVQCGLRNTRHNCCRMLCCGMVAAEVVLRGETTYSFDAHTDDITHFILYIDTISNTIFILYN